MARRKTKPKPSPYTQQVGGRLNQLRSHLGIAQDQMADRLGIRLVTYGKNERGEHLPVLRTVLTLRRGLGVSLEWLLFGRGPMFEKDWRAEIHREARQETREELAREVKKEIHSEDVFTREVAEMIELMKAVPLLRHKVMGNYQELKLEHEDLIRRHLDQLKEADAEIDDKL